MTQENLTKNVRFDVLKKDTGVCCVLGTYSSGEIVKSHLCVTIIDMS